MPRFTRTLPVTAEMRSDGDVLAFSVGADSLDTGNSPLKATRRTEMFGSVYVARHIDRLGIVVADGTAPRFS
jgi:hypothetical protein